MAYEQVQPAAEHPGLAESVSITLGPEQMAPDPMIFVFPRDEDPRPESANG